MRRVLSQNGILISDDESNALIKRYADDMGFNYSWFLKEADPQEYLIGEPKVVKFLLRIFTAKKNWLLFSLKRIVYQLQWIDVLTRKIRMK